MANKIHEARANVSIIATYKVTADSHSQALKVAQEHFESAHNITPTGSSASRPDRMGRYDEAWKVVIWAMKTDVNMDKEWTDFLVAQGKKRRGEGVTVPATEREGRRKMAKLKEGEKDE